MGKFLLLVSLIPSEVLYLSTTTKKSISVILTAKKKGGKQQVYYVSQALT